MMFKVRVRRVVREDTIVMVEASSKKMAVDLAVMDATSITQEHWDTYYDDYLCNETDVEEV